MEIKLNKTTIEAIIPPKKGRDMYTFKGINGLKLQVTSKGAKSFKVIRYINGRQVTVTLGRYPDLTVDDVKNEAISAISRMAKGMNPNTQKRSDRGEFTLNELFERYLELHSKPSKKTWKQDQTDYDNYLKIPLGARRLSDINNEEAKRLHVKLGNDKGKPIANKTMRLLRAMYNKAIEWKMTTEENPAAKFGEFKLRSRDRFLKADEIPLLLNATYAEENTAVRDYVLMSLFTGQRQANVLAMKYKDIDFKSQQWWIPGEFTKNGNNYNVHLLDNVLAIIRERKRVHGGDYVFAGDGGADHLSPPYKGWDRIRERMGIADIRMHDLRRTLASWQAQTGSSLHVIAETLGHKNLATTEIYAILDRDPIRKSMETAAAAMLDTMVSDPHDPTPPKEIKSNIVPIKT